jgi:hypothetical protein
MLGAVIRCTRILWPGKASEKTLRGVISTVCVKYCKTPREKNPAQICQIPSLLLIHLLLVKFNPPPGLRRRSHAAAADAHLFLLRALVAALVCGLGPWNPGTLKPWCGGGRVGAGGKVAHAGHGGILFVLCLKGARFKQVSMRFLTQLL